MGPKVSVGPNRYLLVSGPGSTSYIKPISNESLGGDDVGRPLMKLAHNVLDLSVRTLFVGRVGNTGFGYFLLSFFAKKKTISFLLMMNF